MSDRVALGVLTKMFSPSLVDSVLASTGRVEQRSRLVAARFMVYFVLAMCLFSGQAYEEVARLLTEGLRDLRRWRGEWTVPSTGPIWMFTTVCRPVAMEGTMGAFYRRWRLVAIDGTTFNVPDTRDNVMAFGRPRSGRGELTVGPTQAHSGRRICSPHRRPPHAQHPRRLGVRSRIELPKHVG